MSSDLTQGNAKGDVGDPLRAMVVAAAGHARRKFFELADIARSARRGKNAAPISPLALEAVKRLDVLFDIEREVNGRPAEERLAARQERSAAVLADLEDWMRTERASLSRHAPVAKAMDYMLTRWEGFARFTTDGRICLSNNAAERAIRGLATACSLCPPSSSVWEHWQLVLVFDPTRAALPPEGLRHLVLVEVGDADLIGRAPHDLLGSRMRSFMRRRTA